MEYDELMSFAIELYVKILEGALPIAFVFGLGNVIVNTFLSCAFGGRLTLGGKQ